MVGLGLFACCSAFPEVATAAGPFGTLTIGGDRVALGFLLGMLTALAVIELLLATMMRQRSYVLFAFAMLAMIAYQLIRARTWDTFFPALSVRDSGPSMLVYLVFFALLIAFAFQFLHLRQISRRLPMLLYAGYGALVLEALAVTYAANTFGTIPGWAWAEPLTVLFLTGTLVGAGLVALARGVHAARFYNVAFAGAGIGIVVASVLDRIASAPQWSDLWSAMGVVWAALFLGLALAQRIRQAERHAAQLGEFAYRDQLTGIPNRRAFDETLDREWRRALRAATEISLVMFDIDHFKAYNDRYGHQRGDECLRQVAVEINDAARRAGDFAARYGGEEFAMILANTSLEGAQAMAESVRLAVRRREIEFGDGSVTISGGCATLVPADWQSQADLIAAADAALYIAKATGRDRIVAS